MFCCKRRLMVCLVIGAQTKFHWLLGTTETARGRQSGGIGRKGCQKQGHKVHINLHQGTILVIHKDFEFLAPQLVLDHITTKRTKEEGQCSCALFANQNITGIESLLSKEIPLSITCGTEGQAICNSTCVSLVQTAKDKGPIILCGTLKGHIVGLKPFVFAKACATGKWVYTGLAGKKPICCHEGKPFPCA
uniref:Uncharacterized protein n=1 Tax=Timema poppense TaxID=170557 RepID=A0A7R9CZY5_TIMPO|nr:unnamed protein product [Timema poppensis]